MAIEWSHVFWPPLIIFLATFSIGIAPLYFKHARSEANMDVMANAGVGMLLGTAFMLVIPEGVKSCLEIGGSIGVDLLVGFFAVYLLDQLAHSVSETLDEPLDQAQGTWSTILHNNVSLALILHGFSDGLALGTTLTKESLMWTVLLAISIHRIPATLSLTSVMISEQKLAQRAIIANILAFALSSPIGYLSVALLHLGGSQMVEWLGGNLLLVSAGSLLYASFSAFKTSGRREVIYVLCGVVVPVLVSLLKD